MLTGLAYLLTAAVCGGLGAILGLGGGVFLVPVLTLVFHVPIKTAIAASLVAVVATSTAAGAIYVLSGLIHVRLAMTLEVATTLGALLGGLLARWARPSWLEGLFGVILLGVGYLMARRSTAREERCAPTGTLDTQYDDPALGQTVRYGVRHLPYGLAGSLTAGIVSSLLGIGGGVIKVPLMHLIMAVPMKPAIATSNFMIGVTAATGALVHYQAGLIDPAVAAPTALGGLLGAQIGARIARRAPGRWLRHVFMLIVLFLAIQMLRRAWP